MRPEGAIMDEQVGQEFWTGQKQAFLEAFRLLYGKPAEELAYALLDAQGHIFRLARKRREEEESDG